MKRTLLSVATIATLAIVATMWAPFAVAGHVTGNGGDAVVCRDSGNLITSIELLDYYEGRVERGMMQNLNPGLSVDQNLDILMQRMSQFESHTTSILSGWRVSFYQEASMLSGVTMVDVPDSNHIAFPRGCTVEQIAIQKTPQFPGDKRYTINKDLWDAMDTAHRAGLIMHELIYRQLIAEAHQREINSKAVRFLNSVLSANRMDVFTYQTYLTFLRDQLYFNHTMVDGHPAHLSSVQFDEQGRLTEFGSYYSSPENPVQIGGLTLVLADKQSLRYKINHSAGIRSYRLNLAPDHRTFQLNGFEFFAEFDGSPARNYVRPVELDVDSRGKILALRGALFKWQAVSWPSEKDLRCHQIAIASSATGGIVCEKINLSFGPGDNYGRGILYSEVAFNSDRRILSAKAIGDTATETLEVQFAVTSGFFHRIQCTGKSWLFSYGSPRADELMCEPGIDITFYVNGRVQSGGYQRLWIKVPLNQGGMELNYSDYCGELGGRRLPPYLGHENGKPANGVVSSVNEAPLFAKKPDGTIVKLYGQEYIEMDENGDVTMIQPGYCSN